MLRGVLGLRPLGCLGPTCDPASVDRARSSRGFILHAYSVPRPGSPWLPRASNDELRASFHLDGAATQAPEEEA